MRAFPAVRHFVHTVDTSLQSLDQQKYPLDSDYPHWPDLHTLTLIDAMCTKPTMVRNTMFPRIASESYPEIMPIEVNPDCPQG